MDTTYKAIGHDNIEIAVLMMRDFYAIDGYPIDIEVSKKLFSEFIDNENLGKAWLILSGNEIVGYAILTFVFNFEYKGKIAFVDELFLAPASRGKGIGRHAMEFIQMEAKKMNLKLLYLEVEYHNANAQTLYESTGFETHRRKIMKYKIKTD